MKAMLLVIAFALVAAPVILVPTASAHLCVSGCNCPPTNDGLHLHYNPAGNTICYGLPPPLLP